MCNRDQTKKKPLIILSGPTAVGKTALSIKLAKAVGGEIISADSMQVYRGMDIGTAKITNEEMQGVPHFLIDILDPSEEFNVVLFQKLARECIDEILGRGHIPIITGGTGFYIQSVLYGIDFQEDREESSVRKELEALAEKEGGDYLYELLLKEDPVSAQTIHKNNVKKVIRAIEFHRLYHRSIAEHNEEERKKEAVYHAAYFVLDMDRKKLYERIEKRIDIMVENGLLEEVTHLREQGFTRGMVSMSGLGYKEILAYLDGEIPFEEAIAILKRETRHFAKRQLTWFRRERDVIWFSKDQAGEEEILEQMLKILEEKGIRIHGCLNKGSFYQQDKK